MNSESPNNLHRDGDDAGAREKLVALRGALLRLHKSLIDMERRDYEREHGVVNVGELFRLVVDDPQFAWLHNISEFVVRIDETLTGKEPVSASDGEASYGLARKMFTPTENGDAFQKQYFAAIQRDPAVVMDHAELARLFAQTLPKEPAE
ncbi:MAG TPA: hypothetical protein VMT51_12255 [Dongiaceae bacterium]|nr:hypothetical protein [Dongiaceae bacterium]